MGALRHKAVELRVYFGALSRVVEDVTCLLQVAFERRK
jgi:hypothetical protein